MTPTREELAKVLCDNSSCHHKCHDTTDCVVEDEAQLRILEDYLPSMLTNEEKVSVKGKCIQEMANDLYENRPYSDLWEEDAQDIAKVLYNAGYRKQSENEILEAVDEFRSALMDKFIDLCRGNDFNKINLLLIGETVDRTFDDMVAKMKGGEE